MAVSGGFTLMMDRLQKELDLDYVYCNDLIFNNGKLGMALKLMLILINQNLQK